MLESLGSSFEFPADATPGSDDDMTGRRPIPPRLTIRWHILFPVDVPLNDPSGQGPKPSRKIDARLSSPLLKLPQQALPDGNPPSGVASGYVWFDVMGLLVAPYLVKTAALLGRRRSSGEPVRAPT